MLRPAGRQTRGETCTEDSHVSGIIIASVEIEVSDVNSLLAKELSDRSCVIFFLFRVIRV